MTGPRARFGVSAWIYGDAPLERTLARIAAAGYDGVELPGEPDRWRPAELRRMLRDHGLAPVALTASCMLETERDLAHPDPRVRGIAVEYVRRSIALAAEIEAPLVQMLASGEPRLAPLETRDAEWAWSVAGMQAAAAEAERAGVRIAVEPLNRYEGYLVTSTADALAYLDAVGSPAVGVTSPSSILTEVVLPAPFCPRKPNTSPRETVSVRSWTATRCPKTLRSPWVSMAALELVKCNGCPQRCGA